LHALLTWIAKVFLIISFIVTLAAEGALTNSEFASFCQVFVVVDYDFTNLVLHVLKGGIWVCKLSSF